MHVVPMHTTPLTPTEARDGLLAAMPGLNRPTAALLLALVWLETARGRSVQNFNVGNITANDRWTGSAWLPPWFAPGQTDPHLRDLHERMIAGTAPMAFRAYGSAAEGFADFARVLNSQFRSVVAAAGTGDPAAFVHALHDSGYSRDYNVTHIASVSQLRDQFEALVAHLPAGAGVAAGGAFVLGAALIAIALLRRKRKHR
jgi:hypothetical protein